jgi:hypothetical protein
VQKKKSPKEIEFKKKKKETRTLKRKPKGKKIE